MGLFNIPLGMNISESPLVISPFVAEQRILDATPPGTESDLLTEGGSFILTEGGDFLTTE